MQSSQDDNVGTQTSSRRWDDALWCRAILDLLCRAYTLHSQVPLLWEYMYAKKVAEKHKMDAHWRSHGAVMETTCQSGVDLSSVQVLTRRHPGPGKTVTRKYISNQIEDILESMQSLSEHPERPRHEEIQDDFYIHALLLLFFASQNRPMVATKYVLAPKIVLTSWKTPVHYHCHSATHAYIWSESGSPIGGVVNDWHHLHMGDILLKLAQTKNRPLCRAFVEVGLDMYLEGISLSEMEAMMAVARLESGGQLVGPLQQEILLSWSAMVFLTLQAIGLPLRPSGVSREGPSAEVPDHGMRILTHLHISVSSVDLPTARCANMSHLVKQGCALKGPQRT